MEKSVGFIVFENFAMWQVSLLQMFLKNAGYAMDTLSVEGGLIQTDGGVSVQTESIQSKNANTYDLLMMPGGQVTNELVDNAALRIFLQEFNGLIAASCASSAVVGAAGLLNGKEFTTMPHIKEEFADCYAEGIYMDCDIVPGDTVITSRGFAHYEFMDAVLTKLGIVDTNPRIKQIALKLSRNQ